jgi:hypothetical protein
MSLTTVLQTVAEALTADSTIESTCQGSWGKSLRVFRRVGELYMPEPDEAPMVQLHSGPRSRSGHYMIHGVTLAVFAGSMDRPAMTDNIMYSSDEAAAESLAERCEIVAMQSFGSQGVAAEASEDGEDLITGPLFVAQYSFVITLKNEI